LKTEPKRELQKWYSSPDIIRITKSRKRKFPREEAQSLEWFGGKNERKETTRTIYMLMGGCHNGSLRNRV
jgi:hypothetical protein